MANPPRARYSDKTAKLYHEAIKDPSRTPPTFTEMAAGGGALTNRTPPPSKAYRDTWERCFGKKARRKGRGGKR